LLSVLKQENEEFFQIPKEVCKIGLDMAVVSIIEITSPLTFTAKGASSQ
jgi:hypothetical protein